EGDASSGSNPNSVVASGNVEVRAVGHPTLTRGITNHISSCNLRAKGYTPLLTDVEVMNRPACLFRPVAVQVQDHSRRGGPHHHAVCHSQNRGITLIATIIIRIAGRCKIKRSPDAARAVTPMGS